jgi:hypothetical protein
MDPYHWLTDPDLYPNQDPASDPDPAFFISGLQDAKKVFFSK